MSLYHCTQSLLHVSTAHDTDQTGKSLAIIPSGSGLQFRAFVDLEQSGGSGSPTTTLYIETSYDGHWIAAAAPITLNSSTSQHSFVEISELGPLVRARTVLAGNVKPSHTVTVKLAATGTFQVREKTTTYNTVPTADVSLNPVPA